MAVHEGIKYPCGQCGKEFSLEGNLAEHERIVYVGIKYPCGQCGKQFSHKGNLHAGIGSNHVNRMLNQKPACLNGTPFSVQHNSHVRSL